MNQFFLDKDCIFHEPQDLWNCSLHLRKSHKNSPGWVSGWSLNLDVFSPKKSASTWRLRTIATLQASKRIHHIFRTETNEASSTSKVQQIFGFSYDLTKNWGLIFLSWFHLLSSKETSSPQGTPTITRITRRPSRGGAALLALLGLFGTHLATWEVDWGNCPKATPPED